MNCQPPEIISVFENFPYETGESFVGCGGVDWEMVKKYKKFGKLTSYRGIKTTMIYTHITNKAINRIQSPLDRLNLTTEDKSDKKNDKKV